MTTLEELAGRTHLRLTAFCGVKIIVEQLAVSLVAGPLGLVGVEDGVRHGLPRPARATPGSFLALG